MKINIVTVRSGWILQKIAERICQNSPTGVDIELSHTPRNRANNFYVDITNCYGGKTGGKDIGLFTHIHENNMKHVPDLWFTLDWVVHMSKRSFERFTLDSRFTKYNPLMSYKMPGEIPDGFDYIKPTIGIFQRGKYEGKGFNLMLDLCDEDIVKEYKWIFVGNDWGEVIQKLEEKTEVLYYGDKTLRWPGGYLSIYQITDYVLIPSKWEGGPMSLIEAAALGKKIISARVGWAREEIPVGNSFEPGDKVELAGILRRLVYNRLKAREVVEDLSYRNYASYVVDCFEKIK